MRKLRGLVRNRLVEVTTRTFQGRFLLRPSREVNQTILGVLGRSQRRTEMRICGFTFLSNHYHMLVVPESTEQLSTFMGYLNGNLARKVGRLHDWHGKFWERRYQHIIVSDEAEAQVARLKYLLSQGVKEGLVRHPSEWPGAHCVDHLLGGHETVRGGVWRDQTKEYNARRVGKVLDPRDFLFDETVGLDPILCWQALSRAERCGHIEELLREVAKLFHHRRQKTRRTVLGAKRILRREPHDQPARMKRSPAPAFHAITREHHEKLRELYSEHLELYRDAARQLKDGVVGAVFPAGCFPPRLPYVPEARAGP